MKKKNIENLREQYPVGTRIMVDQMAPDPCPVEPGTIGTVDLVDEMGQIHCTWDNGRVIALVPQADNFHIHHPKGAVKEEWLRSCLRLTADEFIRICQELYGPQTVVHFDMDGLWIDKERGREDDWSVDDDQLNANLSEYFDLDVISVHIDDADNTNVWITYVPGKPKQAWYHISADGGKSWTTQYLTDDEAAEQLTKYGYMLVKTGMTQEIPKFKVIAVYDYETCSMKLDSDSASIDAELIDTGSADPCDTDFKEHSEEIQSRLAELEKAYEKGDLCIVGEL